MPEILPEAGIIKLSDLAIWLEVGETSLIKALSKRNIPILKMGKMHRQWSVRLEDIRIRT